MVDEKPFKCPKCSQCFATSDHLGVHQRMHVNENQDLLVKIPTSSSDNASDETPTPTRFLKTAEVDGNVLFEDINPFDQSFKLASKRQASHSLEQNVTTISSTVEDESIKRNTPQKSSSKAITLHAEAEVSSSTAEINSVQEKSIQQSVHIKTENVEDRRDEICSSTSEVQTTVSDLNPQKCIPVSKALPTDQNISSCSSSCPSSCPSSCSSTVEEDSMECNSSQQDDTPDSVASSSSVPTTSVHASLNFAVTKAAAHTTSTHKQTIVSSTSTSDLNTNGTKQNTQTSLQSLLQQIRKQTQSDESLKSTATTTGPQSQEALREQLKSLIKSGQIKIKFTSDPSSPKVQATIVGNIAKKTTTRPAQAIVSTIQRTQQQLVVVQQVSQKQPIQLQKPTQQPRIQSPQPQKQSAQPLQPLTQPLQQLQSQIQPLQPQKQPLQPQKIIQQIQIKPKPVLPKTIAPKEVTTTTTTTSESKSSVHITPMSVLSIPVGKLESWQVQTHPASSLAFAKQKLKQVIQQNNASNGTENAMVNGRISLITSASSQGKYKDIYLDDDLSNDDCDTYDIGGKRKGRLSEDCSPEEKRQRFLERNRAAASRCRQKRKIWVNQLEKKSDDLIQTNNHLLNEINALRSEVAQLKALLLAHKDCPVTLQQKALLGQMAPGSYVAAVSDGQIIAIHQVPNGNIQASSAEEVASSALTDMAARATIELGNHVTPGSVTVQSNDGSVSTIGSTIIPP